MIDFKAHPGIIAVWIVVIAGVGFLMYSGRITWEIAAGFLVTLGLPSLLGKSKESP